MNISFNQLSLTERLGLFSEKWGQAASNLLPDSFSISLFELTHWAWFYDREVLKGDGKALKNDEAMQKCDNEATMRH